MVRIIPVVILMIIVLFIGIDQWDPETIYPGWVFVHTTGFLAVEGGEFLSKDVDNWFVGIVLYIIGFLVCGVIGLIIYVVGLGWVIDVLFFLCWVVVAIGNEL